jgi:predicted DNA-binding antitoxin AbrB/MazE fold protein
MARSVEAVCQDGVCKPAKSMPLAEGRRTALSVGPPALTPEEVEAQLREWHKVYEGLSEADVAEVVAISLARGKL